MNLATNAAQAMPHGGQLRIALSQRYVRDHEIRNNPDLHEGNYNVLTVQDTGIGMDESTRLRAFEPFFTTKAPGAGTGLGLAMVRAMIREHEGAIALESELGRGTLVRCFFPVLESETHERVPERQEIPTGSGERILYLDDEASLARLGAKRLESLHYRAFAFTVANEALSRFRLGPHDFDLVITDYTMPRMTGLMSPAKSTRFALTSLSSCSPASWKKFPNPPFRKQELDVSS
jgi:CheY-like chemotaxis protein